MSLVLNGISDGHRTIFKGNSNRPVSPTGQGVVCMPGNSTPYFINGIVQRLSGHRHTPRHRPAFQIQMTAGNSAIYDHFVQKCHKHLSSKFTFNKNIQNH